jgi:hypothetical protein
MSIRKCRNENCDNIFEAVTMGGKQCIDCLEKELGDTGCNCCTDPDCCTCYCDDLEGETK